MSCECNTQGQSEVKQTTKPLQIDFLFLDEEICAPCGGTANALEEAITIVEKPLEVLGISLEVNKIHVADKAMAISQKFLSSPTIRIADVDIDPNRTEDDCPSCGTLAGDGVAVNCRTWHWRGDVFQAAPVGKIVEKIMEAASALSAGKDDCCDDTCCAETIIKDSYAVPENLERFFDAREGNAQLSC